MLVLDRDGSILCRNDRQPEPKPRRGYAELAAQPGVDLSGRVRRLLDVAFDQLGLGALELRVRAAEPEELSAPWHADAAAGAGLDLYEAEDELAWNY